MKVARKFHNKPVVWIVTVGSVVALLGLVAAGMFIRSSACLTLTDVKLTVANLPAVDFEVTDVDCDTLAKDEAVRIYASRAGSGALFAQWFRSKTLLFRYDPGRPDNPLPLIRATGRSQILISIPEVSSIDVQRKSWNGLSIAYDIGKVDYP
ncbi:MAG: hypothetical protein WA634_08250 [Silvibacterium sp.]